MSVHNHAIVWIDHLVARIFRLGLDTTEEQTIHAALASGHLHHKANTVGSGKAAGDPTFFPRIEAALAQADAILIVGPGIEKTLLLKHIKDKRGSRQALDIHTEASDHPSAREIIALGRHHFRLGEPARSQR